MSTLRKQENEKITTEREENMTDLSITFKPKFEFKDIRFGEESDFKPTIVKKMEYDDTKDQICEHCRGTGVNPKYEKVNKTINAMFDYAYRNSSAKISNKSVAPYCIYCFGEGKIDRVQKKNEKCKKVIIDERRNSKTLSYHYNDIGWFLIYVANNETFYDLDKKRDLHHDFKSDSLKEYNGSYNVPKSKRNLIEWMREFVTEGYIEKKYYDPQSYFSKKIVFDKRCGWGLFWDIRTDICWCCTRHYTELKPFGGSEGPLEGNLPGPYIREFYRPIMKYDEKIVKAWDEAVKYCKNENYDTIRRWLIKKYGEEKASIIFHEGVIKDNPEKSYECLDCGPNLRTNEYFERLDENWLSPRF